MPGTINLFSFENFSFGLLDRLDSLLNVPSLASNSPYMGLAIIDERVAARNISPLEQLPDYDFDIRDLNIESMLLSILSTHKEDRSSWISDEAKRAFFLSRYIYLRGSQGKYKDKTRDFSSDKAFTHLSYVANISGFFTGDRDVFTYGLGHDVVEDFELLKNFYKEIKEYIKDKMAADPTYVWAADESLQDRVVNYQAMKDKVITFAVEFIFGPNGTTKKSKFRISLDRLTKNPWENYGEYFLRIMEEDDIVLRNKLISVKVADKLHNIVTNFNYRTGQKSILKRFESYREAQIMLDMIAEYLKEGIARANNVSTNDYKNLEMALHGDAEIDVVLLNKLRETDLKHLEAKAEFTHFGAIYDMRMSLVEALHRDFHELFNYLTKEEFPILIGAEAVQALLKKVYQEQQEYEMIGGFQKRTHAGYVWEDGKKRKLDSFLDDIDLMIKSEEWDILFSQYPQQEKIERILSGFAAFGVLIHGYRGQSPAYDSFRGELNFVAHPLRGMVTLYT